MKLQKLAEFLGFSSFCQGVKVVLKYKKCHPIALKFRTQKGGIRPHPDAKFGCNTLYSHKIINDYLQK